jgi:hypothetical protein
MGSERCRWQDPVRRCRLLAPSLRWLPLRAVALLAVLAVAQREEPRTFLED